jgi:transposase-like protein
MSAAARTFTPEYRVGVARRIAAGESVAALSRELSIRRSVLYRWRDAYRKDGEGGLQRPAGRPAGTQRAKPPVDPRESAQRRIAELERKIGQQQVENDFLKRAFKRVEELRQKRLRNGATASTPRSGA